MQRVFITLKIKKILICFILSIVFVLILSISIVGIENKGINTGNTKQGIYKYSLNKEDIILQKDNDTPNIKVYLSEENKIVDMNLEEYVRGVVCAEMPAEFGLEALKAQAVASRTYALAHIEKYGGTKCLDAKGADICDTVNSQVYMSKEKRLSLWKSSAALGYWNKITDAVNQTEGEILTYDGKLVLEPYYFAVSSGRTESAIDVFNSDEPYLKSVSSPGEEVAKNYKTSKKYSINEFVNIINSKYSKANISLKNIKNQINIQEKSSAGSVKKIKLGNNVISGADFRNMFSLNSSNFKIIVTSKDIQIDCLGYGHGVGMSQWGAGAMSKDGSGFEQILSHYYQGIKIEKVENLK